MKTTVLYTLLVLSALLYGARLTAQETYKPELYGLVKARFETALESGDMRFSVRNTRLGVRGAVSRNMKYAIQMELNSQGSFSVLDTYATYSLGGLNLSLGQQQYRFSTELNRGANTYFTNRSFVGKFTSNFHSDSPAPVVDAIGARDIGFMADYRFNISLPVTIHAGLFNGRGVNDPQWQNHVNFVSRVDVGGEMGLRVSGSYYTGKTRFNNPLNMWGAEARYVTDRLILESEVAMQYLWLGPEADVMTVGVVNAMYSFPLPENSYAKSITPQLRWDIGDNIAFMNKAAIPEIESFSGQRITGGLVIGLTDRLVKSELRFNYEHYFLREKPTDYSTNPLLQNKFTIEFFARF